MKVVINLKKMLELCLNIWIKVLGSWCSNLIKDCKKIATETLFCGKAFFKSLAFGFVLQVGVGMDPDHNSL